MQTELLVVVLIASIVAIPVIFSVLGLISDSNRVREEPEPDHGPMPRSLTAQRRAEIYKQVYSNDRQSSPSNSPTSSQSLDSHWTNHSYSSGDSGYSGHYSSHSSSDYSSSSYDSSSSYSDSGSCGDGGVAESVSTIKPKPKSKDI